MPKFLSQLNHEEAKMNSELQIKNQKKREAESKAEEMEQDYEIFATCKIAFPTPLFKLPATVHCFLLLFYFLIFLSPFGLFQIFHHCNSTCFDILVFLYWVFSIKDPRHDTIKGHFAGSLIKFRREPFNNSRFFSFFFTFLHFLSLSH